jgi:hypothetical protein
MDELRVMVRLATSRRQSDPQMMRRNDEIVNEMEFRMLSACNGLSSHLQATAMKGFFPFA